MSPRAPRYSEAELHALVDGCIKRWKTLSSNQCSDSIKKCKENAWRAITTEVNAVNTSGVERKWEDLRHKLQVERSNVKKKLQEIRRKNSLTGNAVDVPTLTDLESKISTLVREEEIVGIKGAPTLGLPTASSRSNEPTPPPPPLSSSPLPSPPPLLPLNENESTEIQGTEAVTTKTKAEKKTNADVHRENLLLQNANLKRQAVVLRLQEEYFRMKLAKLQGPYTSLLTSTSANDELS